MILQKEKRNDIQAKLKTSKNIKPYSVMSIGFSRPQDRKNENRSRQIPEIRMKDKTSSKAFRNQNIVSQNASSFQSLEQLTLCSLASYKNISFNKQASYYSIDSSNCFEASSLDEEISQKPAVLKLSNIINQIPQEHMKKRNQTFFPICHQLQLDQQPDEEKGSRIYVDMKKKIKKLSHGKKKFQLADKFGLKGDRVEFGSMPTLQLPSTSRIYSDSEIIVDGSIFRNKLISQRMDNDVDTDDEQIASGIRRMHRSLTEATEALESQRALEIERRQMFQIEFM